MRSDHLIVPPVSFNFSAVCLLEEARALSLSLLPSALVAGAVCVFANAVALPVVVLPLAVVDLAVCLFRNPKALLDPELVLAPVLEAAREDHSATTLKRIVHEFTHEDVSCR